MRARTLLLVAASATLIVVPVPSADASYAAAASLPDGNTTFYSPFDGPADVTVTFHEDDPTSVIRTRIRRPGHPVIEYDDVAVDPTPGTSEQTFGFSWSKITVGTLTEYVIQVLRDGTLLTEESFTLLPPLVHDVTVSPTPFFPHTQNGYRDSTAIGFTLAADSQETTVKIFEDAAFGRCCGVLVRSHDEGVLPRGRHSWHWDGRGDDGQLEPEGTYYARITATDAGGIDATSGARKIRLDVGITRRTDAKEKGGSAFSHAGPTSVSLAGGQCKLQRFPPVANVACFGATRDVFWRWSLPDGARIEKASFVTEAGSFGCRRSVGHSKRLSWLTVKAPRDTTTCKVESAKITYSYPTLG